MSPLVVAALALLLTGASGSWVGRRRQGARDARRQRQALDTLGAITGRPSPSPLVPDGDPPPQAHVRVVAADAEAPPITPRPLTGGWRPTRATGAAPFRTPAPRHLTDPGVPTAGDGGRPDEGSVRLVRAAPDPPGALAPVVAAPSGGAPAAPSPGLVDAGRPKPAPHPAAAPDPAGGADPTSERRLHFDDLQPADAAPAGELPAPRVAGPDDPEARAAWATTLAASPVAVAAEQTTGRRGVSARPGGRRPRSPAGHRGRSPRRRTVSAGPDGGAPGAWRAVTRQRGGRRSAVRALGALGLAVVVAAGVGAGVLAARGPHAHHSPSAAGHPAPPAVVTRPSHPSATVPPPKVTVAVKLLSSGGGASVYQLSRPAPIILRASGPCWVEIRSQDQNGPVVYEATMAAGQTKQVAGPVWIRLGSPTAVTVDAGGVRVSPPVTNGVPYNLQFQAAQ